MMLSSYHARSMIGVAKWNIVWCEQDSTINDTLAKFMFFRSDSTSWYVLHHEGRCQSVKWVACFLSRSWFDFKIYHSSGSSIPCLQAINRPRTRFATARPVSNAHERAAADLVRGRFIAFPAPNRPGYLKQKNNFRPTIFGTSSQVPGVLLSALCAFWCANPFEVQSAHFFCPWFLKVHCHLALVRKCNLSGVRQRLLRRRASVQAEPVKIATGMPFQQKPFGRTASGGALAPELWRATGAWVGPELPRIYISFPRLYVSESHFPLSFPPFLRSDISLFWDWTSIQCLISDFGTRRLPISKETESRH